MRTLSILGIILLIASGHLVRAQFWKGVKDIANRAKSALSSEGKLKGSGKEDSSSWNEENPADCQLMGPLPESAEIGEKEDCNGFPVYLVKLPTYTYYGGIDKDRKLSGKGFIISHPISPDKIYIGGYYRGERSGYGVEIEFRPDGTIKLYPIYVKHCKIYPSKMHQCILKCLEPLAQTPHNKIEYLKCALRLFPVADNTQEAIAKTEVKDGTVILHTSMEKPMQSFANIAKDWTKQSVLPFYVKSNLKLNAMLYSEDEQFHPKLRFWKVDKETLVPKLLEPNKNSADKCEYEFKPERTYYLEVAPMQPNDILEGVTEGAFRVVFTTDTRTFGKIFDKAKFKATVPGRQMELKAELDEDGFKVKQPGDNDSKRVAKYMPDYCPYLNLTNASLTFTFLGEDEMKSSGIGGAFGRKQKTGRFNYGSLRIFCSKETKDGQGTFAEDAKFNIFGMEAYNPIVCELIKGAGEKPTDIPCQEPEPRTAGTLTSPAASRATAPFYHDALSQPFGEEQPPPYPTEDKLSFHEHPNYEFPFPEQPPPQAEDAEAMNQEEAIPFNPSIGVLLSSNSPTVSGPQALRQTNAIVHKIRIEAPSSTNQTFSLNFQMFRVGNSPGMKFKVYRLINPTTGDIKDFASNREPTPALTVRHGEIFYVAIQRNDISNIPHYNLVVLDYRKSLAAWEVHEKTNDMGRAGRYVAVLTGTDRRFYIYHGTRTETLGRPMDLPRFEPDAGRISYDFVSKESIPLGPQQWKINSKLIVLPGNQPDVSQVSTAGGIVQMTIVTQNLDPLFNLLLRPS